LATMNAVPRRPHVTVSLRLPPDLHARATAALERERRSLTQQVIYLLEQWVEQQEQAREVRELPRVADRGAPPYDPHGGERR
jgi:hypothetical protein